MTKEGTAEHAKTAEKRLGCSPRSQRSRWFLLIVYGVLVFASPAFAQSVTYTRDVAPLLNDRCAMCHHPGGSAPFSLLTYADAKRHAAQIAKVTANRFMPPWKADPSDGPFVGQHPLTAAEIARLQRWVDTGAEQGERPASSQVAAHNSPVWTEGWQLGTPDLVITLPQPYALPAEGTD